MQEAAPAVFVAQPVHQLGGVAALGGAKGIGVPFGGVAVTHGHESGLAAHGQAHVAGLQFLVHRFAQREHGGPLVVGIGLGDAGRFVDAGHAHVVAELHLGFVHRAFDRCRARRPGRAGQRNMPFAGQQAGGGIEADPAGAGRDTPRTRHAGR